MFGYHGFVYPVYRIQTCIFFFMKNLQGNLESKCTLFCVNTIIEIQFGMIFYSQNYCCICKTDTVE